MVNIILSHVFYCLRLYLCLIYSSESFIAQKKNKVRRLLITCRRRRRRRFVVVFAIVCGTFWTVLLLLLLCPYNDLAPVLCNSWNGQSNNA